MYVEISKRYAGVRVWRSILLVRNHPPRLLSHALKLKGSDCGSSAGSEEPMDGLEMSSVLIEAFEAWVVCRASSWICSRLLMGDLQAVYVVGENMVEWNSCFDYHCPQRRRIWASSQQ